MQGRSALGRLRTIAACGCHAPRAQSSPRAVPAWRTDEASARESRIGGNGARAGGKPRLEMRQLAVLASAAALDSRRMAADDGRAACGERCRTTRARMFRAYRPVSPGTFSSWRSRASACGGMRGTG